MDPGASIPLFVTRPALEPLLPQIAERQRAVLESGRYILGPEVEGFESEFAAYLGRRHCIGVANGTDAITIALRALGLAEGDEVIVPAFSFFASAEAVINAGARPVFADIDADTQCLTAATVEPRLTPRTRAILPVHIFGNPAPLDELAALVWEHDLVLVEDAAQAAGATFGTRKVGAFGHAAAFSFYPAKNLGAFGDAGAIVTDDDAVAARARELRTHGTVAGWEHEVVGYNSRLDEIQAAALRVLLPQLDSWISGRRAAAAAYASAGLGELVEIVKETPGGRAGYHLYVVLAPRRDELIASLARVGIEARAYYTVPLHRQPAAAAYVDEWPLPNAERLASEGVALPMGPALRAMDVDRIVDAMRPG